MEPAEINPMSQQQNTPNGFSIFLLGVLISLILVFLINLFFGPSFGPQYPINWLFFGAQVVVSTMAIIFALPRMLSVKILVGFVLVIGFPMYMIVSWIGHLLPLYAFVLIAGVVSGITSRGTVSKFSKKTLVATSIFLCLILVILAFLYEDQRKVQAWEWSGFEHYSSIDEVQAWTNNVLSTHSDHDALAKLAVFTETEFKEEKCYDYLAPANQTRCLERFQGRKTFFIEGARAFIIEKSDTPKDVCELTEDPRAKTECIHRAARDEQGCQALGTDDNKYYCYDKLLRAIPYEGGSCRTDDPQCLDITAAMKKVDVSFCDRFAVLLTSRQQQCIKDNGVSACEGLNVETGRTWCTEILERNK